MGNILKRERFESVYQDTLLNAFKVKALDKNTLSGIEKYLCLDKNSLYYREQDNTLIYYSGMVYMEFPSLDISILRELDIRNMFLAYKNDLSYLYEQRDFESLFLVIDLKIRADQYLLLFDEIPNELKYKLFLDIYCTLDGGLDRLFGNFDKAKMYRHYELLDIDSRKCKLDKYIDEDGYIRIYRGVSEDSMPVNQGISWSTNVSVALFFARRYSLKGIVYSAKIKKEDIVDYITDKGEFEVLVEPDKVIEISPVKFLDLEETFTTLKGIEKYLNLFRLRKDHPTKNMQFADMKWHGLDHSARVSLFVLLLSYLNNLSIRDAKLLMDIAMYHDICREPERNMMHGVKSWDKIKEENLMAFSSSEAEKIARFIISEHCVPYEISEGSLHSRGNYSIRNKKKAELLFKIFRDANALDFWRYNSVIDTKRIHLQDSMKMLLVAKQFCSLSKEDMINIRYKDFNESEGVING